MNPNDKTKWLPWKPARFSKLTVQIIELSEFKKKKNACVF